jgi:DNA-binding XRE family transcriptional regulator
MAEKSLKELRELSGLDQQRVARAVGLDRSFISLIEGGKLKASEVTAAKIRRVLLRAIARRRDRIDAVLADVGKDAVQA